MTTIPSLAQLKRAIQIAEQIENLEAQLANVLGQESQNGKSAKKSVGRPKGSGKAKRTMSPEAREKIAAAQKRRWAKSKKAKKVAAATE